MAELEEIPHLTEEEDNFDMSNVLKFEDEGPEAERDVEFDKLVEGISRIRSAYGEDDKQMKYFLLTYATYNKGVVDLGKKRDYQYHISNHPLIVEAQQTSLLHMDKLSFETLRDTVKKMTEYFIVDTEDDVYTVKSKAVTEAFLINFSKLFLQKVPSLCSMGFLHRYIVTVESIPYLIGRNEYTIEIHQRDYQRLIMRFVDEIVAGNISAVAQHSAFFGPILNEELMKYCKKEKKLKELLRAKDKTSKPKHPKSFLYCLIAQPLPKTDMLRLLLKEYCNSADDDRDMVFYQKLAAVHAAIRWGHWDCYKILMDTGTSILYGYTCLKYAVLGGNKDILEDILQKRSAWEEDELSKALEWACYVGAVTSYGVLVQNGAQPTLLCLYEAALGGCLEIVCSLSGIDPNTAYDKGATPLFAAAAKGHSHIVEYLIQAGADVNRKCDDGTTAILQAAKSGHCDVIEALVSYGADIQSTDQNRNNLLHLACAEGHIEVVAYLYQFQPDVTARNKFGRTPLLCCGLGGNLEVFELLQGKGGNLEDVDTNGNTILHLCCLNGRNELAAFLLENEPGLISEENKQKWRPIHCCAFTGHVETARLLWKHGENFSSDWVWLELAERGLQSESQKAIKTYQETYGVNIRRGPESGYIAILTEFRPNNVL